MKKGENYNAIKKGSKMTVDPIRRMKDIQAISKLLSVNPRNHLLFVMGTNNGLRTGDLLKLKVGDVKGMKVGDTLMINEGKTGKRNILVMNKSIHKSLQIYLEALKPMDDDALFASRKGKRSITVQCVNNMVKQWTRTIYMKMENNHLLLKTFTVDNQLDRDFYIRGRHGGADNSLCKS